MARIQTLNLSAVLSVSAALVLSVASPAFAGKECKDGHWHQGGSDSTPYKSKKAAMRDAVGSWAGFTAWEYGTEWAYFKYAADKIVNCKKHPGRRWTCDVEARPCRRTR